MTRESFILQNRFLAQLDGENFSLFIYILIYSIYSDCTVADMGCGEALLAASVKHKVFSFDLKALNDRVTVADMSKVPLQVSLFLIKFI